MFSNFRSYFAEKMLFNKLFKNQFLRIVEIDAHILKKNVRVNNKNNKKMCASIIKMNNHFSAISGPNFL